jgi:hypothetical protein
MKTIPLPPTSHTPAPYAGPALDQVLAQRKQFLNPGLFLYYKQPIMIVEGKMQYVWDSTGKRYLDGLGGIVTVSVGHCHPHIAEGDERAERRSSTTTTIYLNPNIGAFAEKLAVEAPWRPQGLLLRQLRLRGQRPRPAHGAPLHGQLRRHRPPQRLPRRQRLRHGRHGAQQLEIQRPAQLRRASRRRALPVSRTLRLR